MLTRRILVVADLVARLTGLADAPSLLSSPEIVISPRSQGRRRPLIRVRGRLTAPRTVALWAPNSA
jgi:hypothetical protein